jgi:2-keto-4-pentenoate hydratase/2-oxohepta-3-ene-1,7-dioic acid hydratase in catechol pathway
VKLLSFHTRNGRASYGVMRDDGVIDLGERLASKGAPTLRSLLASGQLEVAEKFAAENEVDIRLEDLAFAPVVPDPEKIICVGLNYRDCPDTNPPASFSAIAAPAISR